MTTNRSPYALRTHTEVGAPSGHTLRMRNNTSLEDRGTGPDFFPVADLYSMRARTRPSSERGPGVDLPGAVSTPHRRGLGSRRYTLGGVGRHTARTRDHATWPAEAAGLHADMRHSRNQQGRKPLTHADTDRHPPCARGVPV